jgi:hypothetical protein
MLLASACAHPVDDDGVGAEQNVGSDRDTDPADMIAMDGTLPKRPEQLRGDVEVALNTGSAFAHNGTWHEYFCVDNETCMVGDVTGDGKDDIVTFTKKGPVYVAVAGDGVNAATEAKPFRNSKSWHGFFCANDERCLLGDVNGDGKKDIIALAGSGSIWVAYSNGTSFGKAEVRGSWTDVCARADRTCEVGDVNGDKKADIVGGRSCNAYPYTTAHRFQAALFNGDKFVRSGGLCAAPPAGIPDTTAYDLDVGDVTGDGKADIVLFSRNAAGEVWVVPSVNGSFPAGKRWKTNFCVDQDTAFGLGGEFCALADVAGDGKLDVVSFTRGEKGKISVAASTGTSFGGTSVFAGSNTSNRFCTDRQVCLFGNVDGKGKADAVAFLRGTGRSPVTRPVPAWKSSTPKVDLRTCRNNAAKIGLAKIRDLPPEVQRPLLVGYELEDEGSYSLGPLDLGLDSEVVIYVAPRNPNTVWREVDFRDAVNEANEQYSGASRPLVVVADEVRMKGDCSLHASFGTTYKTTDAVVVADRVVATNAKITNGYRFGVIAGTLTGSLESQAFFSNTREVGVSKERLFLIGASLSDELMFADSLVTRADLEFRSGGFSSLAGLAYPYGQFVLSSNNGWLPKTLEKRAAALDELLAARMVQLTTGLDIAGTNPKSVPPLAEVSAARAAQSAITDLKDMKDDFFLLDIRDGVDSLTESGYQSALNQSVGVVAQERSAVASARLAEMKSRVAAAEANVDRARLAVEAASARQENAENLLQSTTGFGAYLSAAREIAKLYPPASAAMDVAEKAIDMANGVSEVPGSGGEQTPGSQSALDLLKDGASKGANVAKQFNAAWSSISGLGSEPECQESLECKAYLLDLEAANAALRGATSELSAAHSALAGAEAGVRLAAAEKNMYAAVTETLLNSQERASRRSEAFCSLAQVRLDAATLAVNQYRRIRALHDAPLDPKQPGYNSQRYNYAMVSDFDSPVLQETLNGAMAETDGQPLQWTSDTLVVGASDGQQLAQLLRGSKVTTYVKGFSPSGAPSVKSRIEVEFRLVEGKNGWTSLQVGPSASALRSGATPLWLTSAANLAARRAVQAANIELIVSSAKTGVLYNLPVVLERSATNTLVLQRSPRLVQEMSLDMNPATGMLTDRMDRTQPGTYNLSLALVGDPPYEIPWRFFESLDKSWTLIIDICPSGTPTNGVCITPWDLNSITDAQLTIDYRHKT